MPTRPTTTLFATLCAAALVASACTGAPREAPDDAPTVDRMARDLGRDVMEAMRRGFAPEMSPEVSYIPRPYNTVVRFGGKNLGTLDADPRSSHSTPWDYHQRVPIMLYGPGFIRANARLEAPVDVTDIAPTLAELTGSDFEAPDGQVLDGALLPRKERNGTPKAIAVVAYDGGGWNLLEHWPDAWPFQKRIATEGATYTNATIGSAPSVTTAIHANLGTGAYPMTHGLSEINGRLPDGSVGETFFDESDPQLVRSPTFADHYDAVNGNEPWVGIVAYESWHLTMMSHGAQDATIDLPGEPDRDEAVLWEPGEEGHVGEFFAREDFYELPGGLPGDAELEARLEEQDQDDGELDGEWMGWDLADPAVVPALPAFVDHQREAMEAMLAQAPLGEGDHTDLFFVELKPTDFAGHLWNMVAPEEEPVFEAHDAFLETLVTTLEERVGEDGYVVIVTADHGQTPLPETAGGLRIHPDVIKRTIEEHFEVEGLVQKITPSGLFLQRDLAAEEGITDTVVARFVATLRYRDVLPNDADTSRFSEETLDERVFAAALPHSYMSRLTAEDVAALPESLYPEGDLTGALAPARYAELLEG